MHDLPLPNICSHVIMARGTQAPLPVVVPKVEYELAKDEVFKLPAGVFDGQARGYGCEYLPNAGC